MRVLFVGSIYEQREESKIIGYCRGGLPIASNVFQWNIIDGLIENGLPIDIVGSIPVGNYPSLSSKFFFRSLMKKYRGCDYHEIGFLNFYPMKHLIRLARIKQIIRAWIKVHPNEHLFVLFYDLYNPYLSVIKWLKKWKQVKSCLIVPDLTGKYRNDMGYSGIKKQILKALSGTPLEKAGNADSYVLLTDQMRQVLDIGDSPYVIIDGIVKDEHIQEADMEISSDERIIMYAGNLARQYNIEKLLEVVESMKEFPRLGLWFCGKGNAEEMIVDAQQKDPRIRYLGLLSKEELHKVEKKVSCFINPRTNNGEYTKYSFPSKNLEYLLAGKPVIAYKLDGMSDDYDDIFLYVKDDSEIELKNMLITVYNMSNKEIEDMGEKVQNFVVEHNGAKKQAEKILDMFVKMERI